MKSKKKSASISSSSGRTTIYVIVGIVLLVLIVGYLGIQPGGFLLKWMIQNAPSQESSIPVSEWKTYESINPKFSLKYPSDWVYQVESVENSTDLFLVTFLPGGGDDVKKLSAEVLRVLDKKDAISLQDWVNKYTTSDDTADKTDTPGGKYILYGVKDITDIKIGEINAISYTFDTFSGGKAEGTLVMSDKYVFAFVNSIGKAQTIKPEMIKSLTY
ncbi:MAG: hypothetical protein Q7K55_05165 [Candidatus Levybacteria bacterium]|nr:hypothetical protein [Candidatus Levybacteria bacterium]